MDMITDQKDGYSYFQNLSKQNTEAQCTINGSKVDLSNEDFLRSVREAVKSVREEQSKQTKKRVVKFAGEKIEYFLDVGFYVESRRATPLRKSSTHSSSLWSQRNP